MTAPKPDETDMTRERVETLKQNALALLNACGAGEYASDTEGKCAMRINDLATLARQAIAERDEAMRWVAAQADSVKRLREQRAAARAEVERLKAILANHDTTGGCGIGDKRDAYAD